MKSFKLIVTTALAVTAFTSTAFAQARQISVMSWNVENLFDTEDQPDRIDEEFLPEGKFEWTEEKLILKMKNLARVITSVKNPDGSVCPDFLGMVEVEHAQIAQRFNREFLQECKYDKILADPADPDPRGIRAVSLTRLTLAARPISHKPYPGGRFIQEAKVLVGEHPLFIFVNHWKSRRSSGNGSDDGENKRVASAQVLSARLKQLMEDNPATDFVAMGDFNDEPENKSLKQVLHSTMNMDLMTEPSERPFLWNPAGELIRLPAFTEFVEEHGDESASAQFRKVRGTYYYGGDKKYLALDNFHLAPGLLDNDGFTYAMHSYQVYRHPSTSDAQMRPIAFRGGANPRGVADHFPILLRLNIQE